MTTTNVMPSIFIGHGNPMNALEHNRYTQAWHEFGATVPTPRAILAISAHWYGNGTAVTAMDRPKTIHDFAGFPAELFAVRYGAPGSPEVAAEVAEVLAPMPVGMDRSWGLDHGTWSILVHMFPEANVPVLQLSIDARLTTEQYIELGSRLAPLREQGILIFASGNVVHNLRRVEWDKPETGAPWNVEFDTEARRLMTTDPAGMGTLVKHKAYALAVPTPDHFVPVLYLAGLAKAAGTPAKVLIGGYALGSLSMTSFVLPGS
jgi:4,5-DOPA dioxygenase extradiol